MNKDLLIRLLNVLYQQTNDHIYEACTDRSFAPYDADDVMDSIEQLIGSRKFNALISYISEKEKSLVLHYVIGCLESEEYLNEQYSKYFDEGEKECSKK